MTRAAYLVRSEGPLVAGNIREGDPYEVSKGHPVECLPAGGRGARANLTGGEVLDTDPEVSEAGIDPGYTPEAAMLRAPDVAVGNVPNAPGWVRGVPKLALEYADTGQDEEDLQRKIKELLAAGTEYVWVVRLDGPRRVEVHQLGRQVRVLGETDTLEAPGILRNSVPVRGLYDREVAHQLVLRNLLQRQGYDSLEAVQQDSKAEGKAEGKAEAVLRILEIRGIPLSEEDRRRILACRVAATLDEWVNLALTSETVQDLLLRQESSRRRPT